MVQLATQRTALFLYTVLVLLPAAVFGGLLWYQLSSDHRARLESIPREAEGAMARLRNGIRDVVQDLVGQENEREFFHYNQDYFTEGTVTDSEGNLPVMPLTSPLIEERRPEGIRGWFQWDINAGSDLEPLIISEPNVPRDVSTGEMSALWAQHVQDKLELQQFIEELIKEQFLAGPELVAEELEFRSDPSLVEPMSLELIALNLNPQRDPDCIRYDLGALRERVRGLRELHVTTGRFELRAVHDGTGLLRIVALRMVLVEPLPRPLVAPDCFDNLEHETFLMQGFEIDLDWLLVDLPRAVADQVLDASMRFVALGEELDRDQPGLTVVDLDVLVELDVQFQDRSDAGTSLIQVAASSRALAASFRTQELWLLGVAIVMVISLTVGIRLLLGSVRTSQEQARRTENFVAAVTHELRTPLASVKMYGEMLKDGWVKNEEQRAEYLERIVNEADRLDGLVDMVLQKRRLSGQVASPEPGDLNLYVSNLIPDLRLRGGKQRDDLAFDLQPGLPPVLLTPEAVREVLVNLVENARKYAPGAVGSDGAANPLEPIRVVTRLDRKQRVVLEVQDRGPGIPEEERGKVFEAFYRIGDEQTRRTTGTGLGLHLVQLQVKSMRGRVQVLPRPGGGTILRVTFKTLKPGTVA